MRRLIRILVAIATATAVQAQESAPEKEARGYFDRGTRAFDEQHYVEALAAFSAGYELSHKPAFLYNMAECARLLGDRGRAYDLYRRYLEATPDTRRRAEVEKWIGELAPPPAPEQPAPAAPPAPADEPWLHLKLKPSLAVEQPQPAPAPPPSLSHQRQIGFVVRGELSARTGEGGPSAGLTMGLGRNLEIAAVVIITDPVGARATGAWLFRPAAALKPFLAAGVPVFFKDGARLGGHGGAGLQWDLHHGFGLFAEAAGEYFPDLPEGFNKAVVLLSAGAQARAF